MSWQHSMWLCYTLMTFIYCGCYPQPQCKHVSEELHYIRMAVMLLGNRNISAPIALLQEPHLSYVSHHGSDYCYTVSGWRQERSKRDLLATFEGPESGDSIVNPESLKINFWKHNWTRLDVYVFNPPYKPKKKNPKQKQKQQKTHKLSPHILKSLYYFI